MTRLLAVAVLSLLLWLGIERLAARLRPHRPPLAGAGASNRAVVSRQLVRCDGCGVYFEESRARGRGGTYCSDACRSSAAGQPRSA